jgi:hypothetical protein
MSETMREEVARAIYKGEDEFCGPYDVLPEIGEFDPETGSVESSGYYRYLADAAITTVLEFLAREAGDVETDLSDDGGRTMITLADWMRAMAKEPRNEQT